MTRTTTRLKQLIASGGSILPSCFDPLSSRIAEVAGFPAVHLTGMGVEATLLGSPDLGLLSMSELVAHVGRITAAIEVPLLADIDTGFGSVLNVQRTIREMERAGAAGVHIEDQALPKHCPVVPGRAVVGRVEALDRVKAALDARRDPDFVIVARTDADTISIGETIDRCNLFLEAGADMVMPILVEVDGQPYAKLSPEAQMQLAKHVTSSIGGPVMNMGGRPPKGHSAQDLFAAGYDLLIFGCALPASANAMLAALREVAQTGQCSSAIETNPGPYWDTLELMRAVKLDEHLAFEQAFSHPDASARPPHTKTTA
jgi:methylisocitrate lyase